MDFFEIVPFTQDREDYRTALLASTFENIIRSLFKKRPVDIEKYLPNYYKVDPASLPLPSIEQQKKDWQSFKRKFKTIKDAIRNPNPSSQDRR